jgi:AraC family transcriptional regulator
MPVLLIEGRGLAVSLSRYDGGVRQPRHRDLRSRMSLILQGGFREEGPGGTAVASPGHVLIKPFTALHEDVFAPGGATLLGMEFDDSEHRLSGIADEGWRLRDDAATMRFAGALLESALAGDVDGVDATAADLLASDAATLSRQEPPAWLSRLRQETESCSLAQIDIPRRAREAGVHPGHVSRLFRRCFGRSITENAQRHAVRRAFTLMAERTAKLSEVALAAGFYDQAHMNRVFRRVAGVSPGVHRDLLGWAIRRAAG